MSGAPLQKEVDPLPGDLQTSLARPLHHRAAAGRRAAVNRRVDATTRRMPTGRAKTPTMKVANPIREASSKATDATRATAALVLISQPIKPDTASGTAAGRSTSQPSDATKLSLGWTPACALRTVATGKNMARISSPMLSTAAAKISTLLTIIAELESSLAEIQKNPIRPDLRIA
jgi:hypothetical protein